MPPTPIPGPRIQSRNLRFSPSKSLRERPEKSKPRGQGWWPGQPPTPGRDEPRARKDPVVDTHPCAQVVRARQSLGRERRERPLFGRRGWGQARGRPPRQSAGNHQQLPPPPLGVRAASACLPVCTTRRGNGTRPRRRLALASPRLPPPGPGGSPRDAPSWWEDPETRAGGGFFSPGGRNLSLSPPRPVPPTPNRGVPSVLWALIPPLLPPTF